MSGPHTSFPVLVRILGDSNLRTVGNGGHVYSANGYDIQFRDAGATTVLDHEIETYDGAAGDLWAWVRIPSVADGTTFYLYYGDPYVSCPLANPGGVWDANYKVILHLTGNFLDSTTNHNDALNHGTTDQNPAQVARGRVVPVTPLTAMESS